MADGTFRRDFDATERAMIARAAATERNGTGRLIYRIRVSEREAAHV